MAQAIVSAPLPGQPVEEKPRAAADVEQRFVPYLPEIRQRVGAADSGRAGIIHAGVFVVDGGLLVEMAAGKFFVVFRADRLPIVFFEYELVSANYKYITRRLKIKTSGRLEEAWSAKPFLRRPPGAFDKMKKYVIF